MPETQIIKSKKFISVGEYIIIRDTCWVIDMVKQVRKKVFLLYCHRGA